MDEDGLQLALDEVKEDHPCGVGLSIAQWVCLMLAKNGGWVDVWSQWPSEERNEEEWAGVLNEVDGAPGDLWTEVLDVDARCGGNALGGEEQGGAVLDDGLGLWVHDRQAVVVAGLGGARQELLGFFDGGIAGDVEGGWEVADGLLAR